MLKQFRKWLQFKQKNLFILFEDVYYGILGVLILVIIWHIIGKIILMRPGNEHFSGFLPLPAFKAFLYLIITTHFWESLFISFFRIIIGLLISSIIGIPLGLIIGFYRKLRKLSHIPIQFVRMISPLAWMPIALIILPGFNEAIIFLIVISTVWPILLNTTQGVLNVEPDWIKMSLNQGANNQELLFNVIFPAAIPFILSGFRLAVGIAWIVLVPAELLGVSSGLGYLVNDARDTMQYENLMAVIIAIGAIGFSIDFIFHQIQIKYDWRSK